MKNLIRSGDGRIILCGRVLIQLDKSQDSIKNIGCILLEKEYSQNKYRFVSLTNDPERKLIHQILRVEVDMKMQIVQFGEGSVPVYPRKRNNVLYFVH